MSVTKIARITALLLLLGGGALAADYEVTVTNLTKGQTFTPLLVVSHRADVTLFTPGEAASAELEIIAESGDIGPMDALLGTLRGVRDTSTNGALLPPGESVTIEIDAGGAARYLSMAGMLIPTNDTFVGMRNLRLPNGSATRTAYAVAYDAGTEANDQNCLNIPGPRCMGGGSSDPADGDEGHIHVGNGFHDLGSVGPDGGEILGPFTYDWRNPVARIEVRRVVEDDDSSSD